MGTYDIPAYLNFLPRALLAQLAATGEKVDAVPGLTVAPGLRAAFADIETDAALAFTVRLYRAIRTDLDRILAQRKKDRAFIDATTAACAVRNAVRPYRAPDFETVIGRTDSTGRVVVGPLPGRPAAPEMRVDVPDFLAGEQVTLFGPPDTAKMSINAMNALNRRAPDEPRIVTELVESSGQVPRWGADSEDSKTPIMRNMLLACQNLTRCFDGSISYEDKAKGRTYRLDSSGLSRPIKRIPGLALPDGAHLLDGSPLPLHVTDLALHLFHNWSRPEALVFYVPKLENEEEAAYFKQLLTRAEALLSELHPTYKPGTIRLFIVFENPRSIFRIREIADALHPHFLGGSLGWHDFLGGTARLFKEEPRYRIPVKADPNIVINHIKESHLILVRALTPIGGIKIGGMYGVLYEDGNERSFAVSMVGYIKDVVTQLKRGLDGFWVAHPSFVRTGLALVTAYRRYRQSGNDQILRDLMNALVPDAVENRRLADFVFGEDVPGLPEDDPLYLRGVLAASLEKSEVIANDDPEEVRYNVFQALQYLTDWLSGNGCVALPATMTNARGEKVFVRVMDDLATAERSRWELWAEIRHGRVTHNQFESILQEELDFIRADRATDTKRVQVKWTKEAERWYPVAAQILRQLVTDPTPPEFATELLLPFTFDLVRNSADPFALVQSWRREGQTGS
jgi:malate synthase